MYVSKVPFFMSVKPKIDNDTTINQADTAGGVYNLAHLLVDGQFEPFRADLAELGIKLNIVSNDKHVPEIK